MTSGSRSCRPVPFCLIRARANSSAVTPCVTRSKGIRLHCGRTWDTHGCSGRAERHCHPPTEQPQWCCSGAGPVPPSAATHLSEQDGATGMRNTPRWRQSPVRWGRSRATEARWTRFPSMVDRAARLHRGHPPKQGMDQPSGKGRRPMGSPCALREEGSDSAACRRCSASAAVAVDEVRTLTPQASRWWRRAHASCSSHTSSRRSRRPRGAARPRARPLRRRARRGR